MARDRIWEKEVGTVGDLRAALADLPDEMDTVDVFGGEILLTLWRDTETDGRVIEVE